jgi:HK97 family phage portal protein
MVALLRRALNRSPRVDDEMLLDLKAAEFPMLNVRQAGKPVFSDWDAEKAIRDGFKASTWVYAANRFIATKVAPVRFFVEQAVSDDEWEPDPDHPAETLLADPNPLMDGVSLRARHIYNLGLAGNGLAHMTVVRNVPLEIWPIMPQYIKPVPNTDATLSHYEFKAPGTNKPIRLEVNQMIHHMLIDPGNLYWGMSPLQAAGRVVDTDIEAVNWNNAALANRAKKDYAFLPTETMTRQQYLQAKEQLRDQHQSFRNAGGFFLGSMPGSLIELGMSPHEMDYINSRAANAEEILAGYGLPSILITGKGIIRNYETAVLQFWQDLAVPLLDALKAEYDRSIMPWFDQGRRDRTGKPKLRFNYDVSQIKALQESFTEKLDQAQRLQALGYPLNVVNQRLQLGMDPLEGGDAPVGAPAPVVVELSRGRPINTKAYEGLVDLTVEWKRLDNVRITWEKQFEILIDREFHAEGARVAKALTSGGLEAALGAINEREWQVTFRTFYRAVVEHFGAAEAARLLQAAGKKAFVFDPQSAFVSRFVDQLAVRKVALITEATRSSLIRVVETGLNTNLSIDDIADNILTTYQRWATPNDSAIDTPRAFRIARTETGTAANWGQMQGARQLRDELDLHVLKRWVSSRDDRVRDTHDSVDGELQELEEKFSNGLLHPNDPNGPAEEVINCRCVASNVIVR